MALNRHHPVPRRNGVEHGIEDDLRAEAVLTLARGLGQPGPDLPAAIAFAALAVPGYLELLRRSVPASPRERERP